MQRVNRGSGSVVALIIATGWLTGCGGGGSGVETLAVSGTITHQGQPVEGATVVFGPSSEGGRSATGVTDASGRFRLSTFGDGDGAAAGTYKVTVSKVVTSGGMSPEEYEKNYDAIASGAMQVPPTTTTSTLPDVYRSMETSPLTAEVKHGGEHAFTFDLQD